MIGNINAARHRGLGNIHRKCLRNSGKAFFLHSVRDDAPDQVLLKSRYIHETDADTSVLEPVNRLAPERQAVRIWQRYLESKFIARIDIFFPVGKAAANAYLLQNGVLTFAEFGDDRRGNIEGKSCVSSLAD